MKLPRFALTARAELKRGIDVATRMNDPALPFSRRLLARLESGR